MKHHLTFASLLLLCSFVAHAQYDTSIFRGMQARSIGPSGMSGRISEVIALPSNPSVIYVATATGGIWKSDNAGISWKPLFDRQPVSSTGAIAVYPPNPSIVWVGTGEGNPRNSSSVGNGIYKSLDGGETWTHSGLAKSEKIHRIIPHPTDERTVFVAAIGPTWSDGVERGVFKTTDGGKSWKNIFFVNARTGCADLVMDPANPNKLIAAMWEHRRTPWDFTSGGPGSGLYVTYDAGETWKKIEHEGLPEGEPGRCGIAVARNNPNVVYALVEAKRNALCRSDDGGRTWRQVNTNVNVAPRPFYYADIRIDPSNENRIYSLHSQLQMSEDGGKTFSTISRGIHPDHHALWINPENPNHLIDGNDGGVAISYDKGRSWRHVENLPLAQFYHISVDGEEPYHVMGGLQDNGSWRGPSDVWESGGIRNYHWQNVGGGDGFAVVADPTDPNIVYSMSQGGSLSRVNVMTGERASIRPDAPDNVTLRWNWNAAIAIDPSEPKNLYYGSQFVHKTTDRGNTWTIVSPDLTTNDSTKQRQEKSGGLTLDVTAAENHTTIVTIAPSPVQAGVMWVGTDDGNVQVTTNGGTTWSNVVKNIPGLPANTYCPHIEPSKFDAATAYAVFDDHRRGNWTTYIFKTTNFGQSWTSLAKNSPMKGANEPWGYALVIEQDPVKKDLLFLGTEFGLFISFDDGANWMKWTHGFPTVSTMALVVHPRNQDLVIGTHGRAAYVLDDVRPLREITPDVLSKPLHLFTIPPAIQHTNKAPSGYFSTGDGLFRGETRDYGALLSYFVAAPKDSMKTAEDENEEKEADRPKRGKERKVTIEIFDERSVLRRRFEGPMEKGINRTNWNLRRDGFRQPRTERAADEDTLLPPGPEVIPGVYTIRIRSGKDESSQKVEVKADPRTGVSPEARRAKLEALTRAGQKIEVVTEVVDRLMKVTRAITSTLETLRDSASQEMRALKKNGSGLKKKIREVQELFIPPQEQKGIVRNDDKVIAQLRRAYGMLGSNDDAPSPSHMNYLRQAEAALEAALVRFNALMEKDVKEFKKEVEALRIERIPIWEKVISPMKRD